MKKQYKQAPDFVLMNLGVDVVLASGGGDNFITAGDEWLTEEGV